MADIHGHVDDGWGRVADAFGANFDQHGELGAACCVYLDGRRVVDLWGGVADLRTGRQWGEDTVALVFSTTKGATAICAHMLVERGDLDLDAPVVKYWPEFGAEGKDKTRVRWFLSHQAGLPGIETPLTLDEACAWEPVIRALERQKPFWEPGTQKSYHPLTYGFLVGEVVRRITGKTLGTFFAEAVAAPLGLSAWIGLPEVVESRVAPLVDRSLSPDLDQFFDALVADLPDSVEVPEGARAALTDLWSKPVTAAHLGGAFSDGPLPDDGGHNTRLVRGSEHPGTGMVSDARSLARMYAATIGEVDGVRLLAPTTVERMCVVQSAPRYGVPKELQAFVAEAMPFAISLGFFRPTREHPMLGGPSFGHPGNGGSLAFADPDSNVGFGYVMNRIAPDTRTARSLVAAVADCVAR